MCEPVARDDDTPEAAYLVAARILAKKGALAVSGVGVNPTRTGFLHAVRRMGAKVREESPSESLGEPVATLVARAAPVLRAIEIEPDEVPSLVDEIVLLACLAARAEGTSVFRGVGELRVKESDRLALVAKNLSALGVRAHSEDETLWVEGTDAPPLTSPLATALGAVARLPVTARDKDRILGGNACRVFGLELPGSDDTREA